MSKQGEQDRSEDTVVHDVAAGYGAEEPETPGLDHALRAGLADYDLSESDLRLLDAEGQDFDEQSGSGPLPVLAIVGRPNVGKSTLVNRVLGRREAVVEDVPGVTRDRVRYETEWAGRRFVVVDTGGWERDARGLAARVAEQAEVAIELADAVLFVVDGQVGATATDEAVVKLLRRTKKPVILAANKVDDTRGELEAAALWSLGLGQPYPVSALHGRGSGDLLDAVLAALPEVSAIGEERASGLRRVALLGRPNVGKSSLLNALAGEDRVVVDSTAGTTRDPVDEVIDINGRKWQFVDTAGIRRRVHLTRGADFYASLRTHAALEKAEVAVVLLDSSEPLSEQDQRIISMVQESGRAMVIAYNKWDLMDEERRKFLEREFETDLVQVQWAPRINVSASTKWHVNRLTPALDTALESWDTRVPTGKLNSLLAQIMQSHPHPVRGGKQPRILYGSQVSTKPPRFVLFTSGYFEAGYRRFIERRLREEFGFEGTPIEVSVRPREKRSRKQ
ncbi:ribosome biogenesis GTPase Der [Kineosporia rhizophila]|uniref:ribosome biogenesis GTPase Der n=1 Tax=Kineosporia TaxID=49184 RepID=UPI001E345F93|nr:MULTISPECIES: ribosome biogenesis GTPase Der [Kineosporia]MCE0539372.1 ribosome biogenesis GTPase Der [Kineosporia rhizophila]GLY19879.1 GTPase Der [Kineosporia sp. NBRC 101677]